MEFNPLWNNRNRVVITDDLDLFGGVEFTYVVSGYNCSVGVFDECVEAMAVLPARSTTEAGARPGSVSSESHAEHVFRTCRWCTRWRSSQA